MEATLEVVEASSWPISDCRAEAHRADPATGQRDDTEGGGDDGRGALPDPGGPGRPGGRVRLVPGLLLGGGPGLRSLGFRPLDLFGHRLVGGRRPGLVHSLRTHAPHRTDGV
ncbi:hypothetical protein RKD49_005524 [Streptomyces glaucescens]